MRALLVAILVAFSTVAVAEEAMFAEQSGPRGILYRVHGKASASTLWLFGTIHVGVVGKTPFSHQVRASLATSTRIALEADASNLAEAAGAMLRLGRYPDGDSLDRHLPPKLVKELHAYLEREHVDARTIEPFKPWAASNLLSLAPATRAGLEPTFAADIFLAAWAKSHGEPIVEIEGFEYQLSLMDGTPVADQVALLGEMLDGLKKEDAAKSLRAMYDAWLAGDEQALQKELDHERESSSGPASKRFEKRLLADRNIGMAKKAEALLGEPGDTFFAVGAAHLLGGKGLVAMLRQRGYDVTPVR